MSTMGDVEYECPLCGENFSYVTQFSYTTFGKMLDFRPYGAACIPTPVPKCPTCGFVFFRDLFSKNEINKLKEKLKTNNIFKTEPDMPNYYYLAKEFELLDKKIDSIIYYYHCAIWQGGIITETLSNILFSYIDKIYVNNKNYYIYKLIHIDLLRRLSNFDKALDLISLLKNDSSFPKKKLWNLLEYQLLLIEQKDTDDHEMSEIELVKYKNPAVRKAIANINEEKWYDLSKLPDEVKTEDFWLEVVSVHGHVFRQVPEKMQNYKMHLAAVKGDYLSIEDIPKKFITEEICLAAIKNENGDRVLQFVPEIFKTPKICLNSVKGDGYNLKYVPDELKTQEMCLVAAENSNWPVLEFMPKHLLTPEICIATVKNNILLGAIPEELRTLEVCLAAYKNHPDSAKKFIPKELRMEVFSKAGK